MRIFVALLSLCMLASIGFAEAPKPKAKVTEASLTAMRDRFLKGRDELRGLAAKPAPDKLSPADAKLYAEMVTTVREQAEVADGVAAKLTKGLKVADQRDSLAELGEEQQLKMQMVMDRMTKANQTASNLLKKFSEVASQIIANMK